VPHSCFADEIAIDFPAVGRVVDGMRHAFLGEAEERDVVAAEVSVSAPWCISRCPSAACA
jgi:hypothetical protein